MQNLYAKNIESIRLKINVKIINQQKHKYFIKNQHKVQNKQKEYYSENIDFVREKVKDYYEKNLPAN